MKNQRKQRRQISDVNVVSEAHIIHSAHLACPNGLDQVEMILILGRARIGGQQRGGELLQILLGFSHGQPRLQGNLGYLAMLGARVVQRERRLPLAQCQSVTFMANQ